MKERVSSLDMLIKEVLSFKLYKNGKEPLEDIDPKERIRRSVWLDDGIDLDALFKQRSSPPEELLNSGIFQLGKVEVKEGFLRRRKVHRSLEDINSLVVILGKIDDMGTGGKTEGLSGILHSELLYPLVLSRPMERPRSRLSKLELDRCRQTEIVDISPRSAVDRLVRERTSSRSDDDLRRLLHRQVEERFAVRTGGGTVINDLQGLVNTIVTAREEEVKELIGNGALMVLARDGMRSPRLEGMLTDASTSAEGGRESPDLFKERFGRMMMESEISSDVMDLIVVPMLDRFRTCSDREAGKLRNDLINLVDHRSSPMLKELVFEVPSENRPFVIELMGACGDRNLVDTLKRIRDFSNMEIDREYAEKALISLGEK